MRTQFCRCGSHYIFRAEVMQCSACGVPAPNEILEKTPEYRAGLAAKAKRQPKYPPVKAKMEDFAGQKAETTAAAPKQGTSPPQPPGPVTHPGQAALSTVKVKGK